ncbi:MAG TPA: ATP-binding cassette domain-containing protein, partial [Chromatiaceae bacterium]|nr:ATP-binding cassette domain-containing protein [Chromatiaceae bacterium]
MALLVVRNLVKEFDGRRVLDGVDLDLEEGQVKVVMGPSGCGKSTLLRCLNRLIEPTSGQIFFEGEDITRPGTDVRALRQRIGFVFQNFALYRHLTALENIKLGLRKLRHLPEAQATARAREELRRMELETHGDKYPAQ